MINTNEEMNSKIREGTALYFLRATPFTDYSEFNYNGMLKEDFFFNYLFSSKGKYAHYVELIKPVIANRSHKTILLTGNQGCGKTTFVHRLKYECPNAEFLFFDFDRNTSHPRLEEYIERLSNYLHSLLCDDSNDTYNKAFYNLYDKNRRLIIRTINADNNINTFFEKFHDIFIVNSNGKRGKESFITEINKLYFNQILSLIVLWHLSKIATDQVTVKPLVFCLDNLDVLVNQDIIERFFKEYFLFIRNVDGIINKIDDEYVRNKGITYNSICSFILICRQHTWARVKQNYPHNISTMHVSTYPLNITDAFEKESVLRQRQSYIDKNEEFFGDFSTKVSDVCSLLNDMDPTVTPHNVYKLFNDDYRQCIITFEDLLAENPHLLQEYTSVKQRTVTVSQGLRGIIYRALFEKFKEENIWSNIGVLDVTKSYPYVSNARLILNYLNYTTYGEKNKCVPFSRIVADFTGIISEDEIDLSLIAMFNLGFNSSWNELVAFDKIATENIETCENTSLMIAPAGHEYLNLIATHFEFFSVRIPDRHHGKMALFSPASISLWSNRDLTYECNGQTYSVKYNFEELISSVLCTVEHCCKNMTKFFEEFMKANFTKEKYLDSPFVYGDSNVLHGERIIHTHIRYIDNYRLYLLHWCNTIPKREINEILVRFISEYIRIGELYPNVLTAVSTERLFPAFKASIQEIVESGYQSSIPINVR